jgi:hypothetical protein
MFYPNKKASLKTAWLATPSQIGPELGQINFGPLTAYAMGFNLSPLRGCQVDRSLFAVPFKLLRKSKSPPCPAQQRRDKDGAPSRFSILFRLRPPFNRFISSPTILAAASISVKQAVGRGFRVLRQPTGRNFASRRMLFGFRDFKKKVKQNNQPPLLFPHFD